MGVIDGKQIDYQLNSKAEIKAGGIPGGAIPGDFFILKLSLILNCQFWWVVKN